jgi:hypothetical protein
MCFHTPINSYVLLFLTVLQLTLSGCASGRPLRPGRAAATLGGPAALPLTSEITQPENPAQPASQSVERVKETELPLPRATQITEVRVTPRTAVEPAITNTRTIVLSEPTVEKSRTVERAGAVIGAAQKDTARELGVKLAALRPAVWVGIVMVILGIAIAAYPPLRLAVGSMTTAVATIVGGIALIVLPSLVVGNELLIIGGVSAGVLLWFLAHRHGALKGSTTGK